MLKSPIIQTILAGLSIFLFWFVASEYIEKDLKDAKDDTRED